MRARRAGQSFERVPAFQDGHQASSRMLTCDLQKNVGEGGKVRICEREPAERVAKARVEAGRDHHELRLESVCRVDEHLPERRQDLAVGPIPPERGD